MLSDSKLRYWHIFVHDIDIHGGKCSVLFQNDVQACVGHLEHGIVKHEYRCLSFHS